MKQNETYESIEKVIIFIENNFKDNITLDDMAEHVGMSKFHFLRIFKEFVGVTPIQFLQSLSLNYAKEHLKNSSSIMESSLDMGLSSTSRLHDMFINIIGVTPKQYKELGLNVDISYGYGSSPFGEALIAYTSKGICYLAFIDKNKDEVFSNFLKTWDNASLNKNDEKAQKYLNNIFSNKKEKYNLYVKGTNFQINIWKALLNIPNGDITTYSQIAKILEKPKAVRAVASAIGSNHIAYLIPCHRVIAKSGAMSGYAWGINRKKILISYEDIKNKENN